MAQRPQRKVPHHSTEPVISVERESAGILYPDVSVLDRPLEPTAHVRQTEKKIVIAAIVIAAIIMAWYLYMMIATPMQEQRRLEENLSEQVPIELPSLAALMPLDDNAIVQTMTDSGANIFVRTPPGTTKDGSFQLIKLPADVSIEQAAADYLRGIDSLPPAELVKLLNGSYVLDVFRNPTSLRIQYADFSSGSIEAALNAAMAAESIPENSVNDSGIDEAGNTYKSGIVSTDTGPYVWRVSVVRLSDVYDSAGLPSTACFVGIRFTP